MTLKEFRKLTPRYRKAAMQLMALTQSLDVPMSAVRDVVNGSVKLPTRGVN